MNNELHEATAAILSTGVHDIPKTVAECPVIKWTTMGNEYCSVISCIKSTLKVVLGQQHFRASNKLCI